MSSTRALLSALLLAAVVVGTSACNREPPAEAAKATPDSAPAKSAKAQPPSDPPAPVELAPKAATTEERISLVENGLMRSVLFKGRNNRHELEDRMAALNVPGVSVAVIHDGEIEWTRAYGVREQGTDHEVDIDTMFQAGSISKPIAVLAALRLVEAGKLDLDEDINAYLEKWTVPANEHTEKQAPTIRHIMSHGAGFTVHGFPGYAADKPVPTLQQVLDGVPPANTKPIRIDKVPGGDFRYSGGGTTVLQQAMIDVVGRPFPEIVATQVLQPAGMTRSTYEQPLPESFHANAASGHGPNGKVVPGKWHTYPEMAAAGLWTTPSDLARVLIDIQNTLADEGGKLLGRKTASMALERQAGGNVGQVGASKGHAGLGFMVSPIGDDLRFGHGGANQGFMGKMTAFARLRTGVVVLANGAGGGQLSSEITNAVADVYGWPGHHLEEIELAPLDVAAFDRIAGTYAFDPNLPLPIKSVRIGRKGEDLIGTLDDGFRFELYPIGPQRYLALQPQRIELTFVEEPGKPTRLQTRLGLMLITATRTDG
jgi:CubicO group peptidase (beta-lactamase class C family)